MRDFKFLTPKEEAALSREELIIYYKQKNEYYKNLKVKKSDIFIGKIFRGLLEKIGRGMIKKEIVFLNDIEVPTEGCIIAANHWGGNDIPLIVVTFAGEKSLKREMFYPLGGIDVSFDFKNKLLIKLLGATKVNRLIKESRQNSQEYQTKLAARGLTVAYWGEGMWNFTDSKPVNPFWPGIAYCAKNAGKPVLPFATADIDNVIYIKTGQPMIINPWEDVDVATKKVENKVAELVLEIYGLVVSDEKPVTVSREEALKHGDAIRNRAVHELLELGMEQSYEEPFLYRPKNPYGDRMPSFSSYEEAIDPSKASHAIRKSPYPIDKIKKKQHFLVVDKIIYQAEGGEVFYKRVCKFDTVSPKAKVIDINPKLAGVQTFTIGDRELFYSSSNGRIYYNDTLKDMDIDDYKDYDIETAKEEAKKARERRILNAQTEVEDLNKYNGPLRLVRRKTGK